MQAVLGALKWIGIVLAGLVAVLLVVIVVLPPLLRPLTNRLGANDAEVTAMYPGDDLVAPPQQNSTRAVTVNAPPALVFALVKQMGFQRGGWYAWDWFYNLTGSADFIDGRHTSRIDPRLQKFGVGDEMAINPMVAYKVVSMDPPRSIVMFMKKDGSGNDLSPNQNAPAESAMSWAWIVAPVANGKTRLILRTRAADKGQSAFVHWLYDQPLEMGGALFGYKTLVGLARTAERLDAAGVRVDASGAQMAGPTQ